MLIICQPSQTVLRLQKAELCHRSEDLTFQTDNFEKVWKSARRREAQGRRVWRLIKLTVVDKLQLPSQGITHQPIESFFYTATEVLSKSSTSTTTLQVLLRQLLHSLVHLVRTTHSRVLLGAASTQRSALTRKGNTQHNRRTNTNDC